MCPWILPCYDDPELGKTRLYQKQQEYDKNHALTNECFVCLPARNHTSDLTVATLFPQRAAATSQSLYLKQETSDPEKHFTLRLSVTSTENYK